MKHLDILCYPLRTTLLDSIIYNNGVYVKDFILRRGGSLLTAFLGRPLSIVVFKWKVAGLGPT